MAAKVFECVLEIWRKGGQGKVGIFFQELEGVTARPDGYLHNGQVPHCSDAAPTDGHLIEIFGGKIATGQKGHLTVKKIVRTQTQLVRIDLNSGHGVSSFGVLLTLILTNCG
jgi:hypothetical protein